MADLTTLQAAETVKLVGSDSTGLETNPLAITANGDAAVVDGLSGGGLQGALSVPTAGTAVEVKVGVSRLTNRKLVTFQATDADFFWGYANTVTAANGSVIKKGATATWAIDPTATVQCQIWVVCATSTKNGRVTESP